VKPLTHEHDHEIHVEEEINTKRVSCGPVENKNVSALKKSKETPDRLRAALSKYSHLLC
jgi:hypothetical protein